MKKYLILIIFVIFTIFLIALSCDQVGSSENGTNDIISDPILKDGFIFAGGLKVDTFGFIDLNDNGILDDGDLYVFKSIIINGNQKVTFNFPDDFVKCSNSGSITFSLSNAKDYDGKKYYCGTDPIQLYPSTLYNDGNGAEIVDGSTPPLPLQLNGVTQIFYGDAEIGAGGFIDMNDNGIIDNGDKGKGNSETINGNLFITQDASSDSFITFSGCGTISVNLSNAKAFDGKTFYCGSCYDDGYPAGTYNAIIKNGNITGKLLQIDGITQVYLGDSEIYVGGFIDYNGNGIMDDGDYTGGTSGPVKIDCNMIIDLDAKSFNKIANSGFISVNLSGAEAYKGKKFYYGTFHTQGIKARIYNVKINSNNMTLIIR